MVLQGLGRGDILCLAGGRVGCQPWHAVSHHQHSPPLSPVQVWSELDPHATHFIPAIQLSTLIQQLRPPLGVNGEQDARSKIQAIIMTVDIPIRHGKV